MIDVTKVAMIQKGMLVEIECPETPQTPIHRGVVEKVLSKKDNEYGVRVLLTDGRSGHLHDVVTKSQLERETFTFYNKLFHDGLIVAVYTKGKKPTVEYFIDGENRKAIFLFENRERGVEWQQTAPYYQENYELRLVGNKKSIKDKFEPNEKKSATKESDESFTHFVLNEEFLFTKEEFYELEKRFRSMS